MILSAVEKAAAAEATVLELSWATGSGLPICCISGSAVVVAGMGSGCRALKEATVSKLFWEQLLDFHKVALWTSGDGRTGGKEMCAFMCATP